MLLLHWQNEKEDECQGEIDSCYGQQKLLKLKDKK